MIALYPGAFKPPHRGHFEVVKRLLNNTHKGKVYDIEDYQDAGFKALSGQESETEKIDKVIVFIGGKERNGISATDAKKVWDIYKKYLPNVEVIIGDNNPMFSAKDYAKANPNESFYAITGVRGEEDFKDLKRVTTFVNRPNVKGLAIGGPDAQRATNFRKALLSGNLDTVKDFFPEELDREEINNIISMVKQHIISELMKQDLDGLFESWFTDDIVKEGSSGHPLAQGMATRSEDRAKLVTLYNRIRNQVETPGVKVTFNQDHIKVELENVARRSDYDFTPYMASILEYMIDEGMKILPLPEIKVKRDIKESSDFFGRTAYYDPNIKEVVLYTEGRHPKDIMRSFVHEMIHHMQNLEGRLGNIKTSDTNEDDNLLELEKEAYLKGNITFRNWEDSIKKKFDEDKDGKKAFARELQTNETVMAEGRYDSIVTYLTNKTIEGVKKALSKKINHYKEGHFGDPTTEKARIAMKKVVEESYPILLLNIPDDIDKKFQKETDLEFEYEMKAIFVKGSDSIMRDGGAYKGGFGKDDDWVEPKLELEFVLDPYNFPGDFQELSGQISDVLRHEIEHLTQAGGNERGKSFDKDALFKGKFGTAEENRFRAMMAQGIIANGVSYLTLPSEIDANIQGLYLSAKKQKRPFEDVVDQYLYQFTEQFDEKGEPYLTKQDVIDVKKVWALRLPALGIKQKL